MKTTKSFVGMLIIPLTATLLAGCGGPNVPQTLTVQSKMPTAEEAVKWALWDAETKYQSFDVVSTNVSEVVERHAYEGQKRGGAEEVRVEKQVFGAAYDAWSKGDSFTRLETNYACDLVITHIKPKRPKDVSTLIIADWAAEPDETNPPSELRSRAMVQLLKYPKCKIVREETYKVNRIVGGELMKCIDKVNQVYVWNTDERDKFHVQPTWVIIMEVSNLEPKNN